MVKYHFTSQKIIICDKQRDQCKIYEIHYREKSFNSSSQDNSQFISNQPIIN